jgi:hypothetical protein
MLEAGACSQQKPCCLAVCTLLCAFCDAQQHQ